MTERTFLFPFLVGLLGLWLSVGCTALSTASKPILRLAPTAVTIPLEREHQDVVDARAPLDTIVCLKVQKSAHLKLVVEVENGELGGMLHLVSGDGSLLNAQPMRPGRRFYELFGYAKPGSPSQCVRIETTQGWSLIRIVWREV